MHNSLKYFRDTNKASLFAQMESFMVKENVAGKSISIEHDGNDIVSLLGYTPENTENLKYSIVTREIGKSSQGEAEIQQSINKVADELGNFICQSVVYNDGDLSIAFLIGQ